jgi:uncharacterized protein
MWDDILIYAAVGFAAQIVDGAIGMAYGITATSVLLTGGVSPAVASACVHASEVFTTGASGLAHWRVGNVDRRMMLRLAIPGAIGGAIGAFILVSVPGEIFRPVISAYLMLLGLFILWKAFRPRVWVAASSKTVLPLGFCGGIIDAIGGGGWGPLVTTTLLGRGTAPRMTIGSVNAAEFFVTATISATFIATIGLSLWPIVMGLVLGGVLAAPFAALVTKHFPERLLMMAVGLVVFAVSLRTLWKSLV